MNHRDISLLNYPYYLTKKNSEQAFLIDYIAGWPKFSLVCLLSTKDTMVPNTTMLIPPNEIKNAQANAGAIAGVRKK